VFGAFLHLLNNALGKAVLFLSAGNIHRAHGSKLTDDVHGALRTVPVSAGLFLVGLLAITGSPPFGPFVSEFTIVSAAFRGGSVFTGAAMLALLFVIFCGMGSTVIAVVQGAPARATPKPGVRESFATVAPVVLALAALLFLGVHVPRPLEELIHDAVRTVGGQP
jgi:hydrogenase-4 component F